jgi:hypothetical protein
MSLTGIHQKINNKNHPKILMKLKISIQKSLKRSPLKNKKNRLKNKKN